jgi:hypothetical protein
MPGMKILRSRGDDVIPFEGSLELIRLSGLLESALVEVGTAHRLADPEPMEALQKRWRPDETRRGDLGGGVSAESGLKTIRGADGLWGGYRPEEVACPRIGGRIPGSCSTSTTNIAGRSRAWPTR